MRAIRQVIQRDLGKRGLARRPGDGLFDAWPEDLTHAARSLAWHPRPHLVVLTGFPILLDSGVRGETDGPLGARFLARALPPLGIRVTLGADPFWKTDLPLTTPLPTLPADTTHLLSIERVGPSWHDGRCYSMRGRDVTDWVAPAADWFEKGRSAGIVTIGIGDGGNELGMGKIARAMIARDIDQGSTIACRVPVDHLIVAGVSNWGAYGLVAAIYALRRTRPEVGLFDPQREADELRQLVTHEQLVDGKTGQAEATVDGLSPEVYLAVLPELSRILHEAGVEA